MTRARNAAAVAAFAALALTACGPTGPVSEPPGPSHIARLGSSGAVGQPRGSVPPSWLGKRALPKAANGYGVIAPTPPALRDRAWTLPDSVAPLPGKGWASKVVSPAPPDVIARSTWEKGCPVAASDLAWVRLTFVGFDRERHTGELLVNASVTHDVVATFHRLYDVRWPIEQMAITTKAELERQQRAPTGDGNNTESFVCRPVTGQAQVFSQHAFGLAIDVDPFQNPYHKGDLVVPERASWYLDRGRRAPGVITPDGPVVAAFEAVGWGWGGGWHSLKDFQHVSANGQ